MSSDYKKSILICVLFILVVAGHSFAQQLVSVTKFGAVADAKKAGGVWVGTDNSKAINKCAAYCRANGFTMFFPKGDYGVASTIWLTDPNQDGLKQASVSVVGSNQGAFLDQSTSARICVLKSFKPGRMVTVRKNDGSFVREPDIVPVIAISNGRQVHIQGLCIQGTNRKDLIAGVAIGNRSIMTSIKNCSFDKLYAGLVFPGIRPSSNENINEGNNDLLLVEHCTFDNAYNIVCGGTQPFACEYRSNLFFCSRSVFTGKLIINFLRNSRGSHKFSSCIFQTALNSEGEDTVYFDLEINEITIDNCHFETTYSRDIPEIIIRQYPGGGLYKVNRIALTNSTINFAYVDKNPIKYRPIIDTFMGSKMIIQGNTFYLGTATRIKANNAIFIGNSFQLYGPYNLDVVNDVHFLYSSDGDIVEGTYDFNHFVRKDSEIKMSLLDGQTLKSGVDYLVLKDKNAFKIRAAGKKKIDKAKQNRLLISYKANDASQISFEAWGGNTYNQSRGGFRSKDLIMIGNKIVGRKDTGQLYERELQIKPVHKLSIK